MMLFRLLALPLLIVATLGSAEARDRRVPSSPAELKLSFAPIVQRTTPGVVNVYAAKMVQNRNPLLDDPIFRRFFGIPGNQSPEQMQRSLGSGVVVVISALMFVWAVLVPGRERSADPIALAQPAE